MVNILLHILGLYRLKRKNSVKQQIKKLCFNLYIFNNKYYNGDDTQSLIKSTKYR